MLRVGVLRLKFFRYKQDRAVTAWAVVPDAAEGLLACYLPRAQYHFAVLCTARKRHRKRRAHGRIHSAEQCPQTYIGIPHATICFAVPSCLQTGHASPSSHLLTNRS